MYAREKSCLVNLYYKYIQVVVSKYKYMKYIFNIIIKWVLHILCRSGSETLARAKMRVRTLILPIIMKERTFILLIMRVRTFILALAVNVSSAVLYKSYC